MTVDRDHVRRVLSADRCGLERFDECEDALGGRQVTQYRHAQEQLRDSRETGARGDSPARVFDDDRVAPVRTVRGEIRSLQNDAVDRQERLGQRPAVNARRAFLGQRFESVDEPGLGEDLALDQSAAVAREEGGATLEGEELAEHLERARVHLGQRDAGSRQSQRRLAQPLPRKPSQPLPELTESRR